MSCKNRKRYEQGAESLLGADWSTIGRPVARGGAPGAYAPPPPQAEATPKKGLN